MQIKRSGGHIFGAQFTAAERKAMNIEINRQLIEKDREYKDDIDAVVLYALMEYAGWRKKKLRDFYEHFIAIHERLVQHYQVQDDPDADPFICKLKLKEIGVDVEAWNKEGH